MKYIEVKALCKKHPQLQEDDVAKIQEWLKKQPHLPETSDLWVSLFLHASHFSVEAAKTRIDNFYSCRTKMKTYLRQRDISGEDMRDSVDDVAHIPLPKLTHEGNRVIFIKILESDRFSLKRYIKRSNFCVELEMLANGPDEGYIFVVDMDGSKVAHLTQVNLMEIKQEFFYIQEGFPMRILQVHFINPVPFMAQVVAILKPFLNTELRNQMYVHEKLEDFFKFVPAECLTNEYPGGKQGVLKELNANYYKGLVEHRDYFLETEQSMRVDESKRPTKSAAIDEIFGLDGNFKKLDID